MNCPCCNASQTYSSEHKTHWQVRECRKCHALYTQGSSALYLGESYGLVRSQFTNDPAADDRAVYFDFMTVGSKGLNRRHGWFDPETKLLTQVG